MEPGSVTHEIGEKALVAVVEVDDAKSAGELARCLGDAGVPAIEITLRTPNALASLETAASVGSIVIGAGTVLTTRNAERCAEAGARFAVSPVFDESVAAHCRSLGLPFVPGAVTPTEVLRVLNAGLGEVKLFPAEPFGGLSLVRSLAAVFPDARFMPTGGIDQESAIEYLAHRSVAAVGGSWIAPASLIAGRDWAQIGERAKAAMDAIDAGAAT
jgi:2-dehydro-3-deoxyphosphogluconate aldolase/(4S)-4-hydroxy-2-oxoglutarate aldolase